MSFQRLSERVEGKSRWKVVPQSSSTGGRETPVTEFVMCSWHEQLPHVIVIGPTQWATANEDVGDGVCDGTTSSRRFLRLTGLSECWSTVISRRRANRTVTGDD